MIVNRLKREQCDRTKHDSSFSRWKILIGPSDWEDHSKGKEGSTRYRIHNLPQNLGPGVYELGVAVSYRGLGREIYKLTTDPRHVVVVYLGKADNVRARLQCYGRTGAHLSNSCSSDDSSFQTGRSLFQEIFSQGFPIVYRWAPVSTYQMQNEGDALRTEAKLLSTFDYAWNTVSNGTRRPDDILQMLNKLATGTRTFSDVAKLLLPFTQRKVGIPIKSSKLPLTDDKLDEADNGSYNVLSRVFKFNRSRPRIVQDTTSGAIHKSAKICGVILADGSICQRPPVEKRVRCAEHKGMRINVSTANAVIRAPKLELETVVGNAYRYRNVSNDIEEPPQREVENHVQDTTSGTIHENAKMCGVILADGSICQRPPVEKRVRCAEHKGMRINVSAAKAIRAPKLELETVVGNAYRYRYVSNDVEEPPQRKVVSHVQESFTKTIMCGIILDDGSTCRRQPVKGRKRCHEHKGRRIRANQK